ncbi:MAG: alanine racemase [Candidatus Baltobacteraceae bacterium]
MIAELVVDLDALRANAGRLASLVAPARYTAVLKANAYGHGLAAAGRALADQAAGFCVYGAGEALALREAGIEKPVLVLGPVEPDELPALHAAGAALALWSEGAFLGQLCDVAARRGAPFAVHAKIDTGVTRLGLDAGRAAPALARYLTRSELELRGVFTHLAAVEEFELGFTQEQLARFEHALAPLDALLRERRVCRHAAASAAAMLFPALRLDAVRAGIATYGIWPSAQTREAVAPGLRLVPALSWHTKLVVVREVEAGRSVGYGCTFHTARPSRIGLLPIGYAEGIPRALSGSGMVLVRGRRAPLVGRVCMNMAFVDVTGVPEARPGDRVTLLGRDGEERIDANELGAWAGTIGYEIVARLPESIPRRYLESASIASPKSSVPS